MVLCISQFQLQAPKTNPSPLLSCPPGISIFLPWMANSRGQGFFSCQIPWGGERKKKVNALSPINTAIFFIDHMVESCHFKHFIVRYFVKTNVCLSNSTILIKNSSRNDSSSWFKYRYKIIDIKINSAGTVKLSVLNSFINMKGCSSNNINRNLIHSPEKHWFTSIAPDFTI